MEPEEKKTKRGTGTRGANTNKKTETASTKTTSKKTTKSKESSAQKATSTKQTPTAKKTSSKKAEAEHTKVTTKKTGTSKTSSTKKSKPAKETSTTRNTTAKKAETTAIKPSIKKSPTKKTTVPKIEKEEKPEEIKLEENIVEKEEVKKDLKDSSIQKQEKKKNKKYIDISIGAIFCVLIIIALLILNIKLGKHAYGILKKQPTNTNVQSENNVSVTQEIGNVVKKTDELVQQMQKKITYSANVTASIYNTQGFNTNTIPNELKLILGWANTDDGRKLKSVNEKNEEVEVIEKNVMSDTIKSTLGQNIEYLDESFNYTKISQFENSSRNKGVINYSDNVYTSILENNQEETSPLIYQEIQKVVKYSEKVIIYVKTAFINNDGNTYQIYKKYKNNNFRDKLLEIEQDKLFEGIVYDKYTGEGAVSIEENSALDSVRVKLDTYKYTFTFDETLQEYYLSEFGRDNA